MSKKLLIFDLDKTLLNDKNIIIEENKKAIIDCKNKGNTIIAYITGRGTVKTLNFIYGLPCDAYACNNGSKIFCENKLVKSNCISYDLAQKFIHEKCKNKDMFIVMEPYKYLNYDDEKIDNKYYFKSEIDNLPQNEIDMISIRQRDGIDYGEYKNLLQFKKAGNSELMVNSKNANKLNALEVIKEYFNIDKKDIISFGDDFSDIEVFKNSGISVAMGNAINELKEISTYVIEDNNSSGIAKFIRKYCL